MNIFKKSTLILTVMVSLFSCKKDANIPSPSERLQAKANDLSLQASSSLITNIKTSSKSSYLLSVLAVDTTYHTDRSYFITSLPSSLVKVPFIKTAMNDKELRSASAISFTLAQSSTVYVAYDPRVVTLPAWLQGWKKLTDTIGISDKESKLILYSKAYAAGTVSLGGNAASPEFGARAQYIVAVKSDSIITTPAPPTVPTPPTNTSFMLGINGHSLGTPAYKALAVTDQISMLKNMGMSVYRQDIDINDDGRISNITLFQQLYAAATAKGVTILPMIYTQSLDLNATEAASYAAGNKLGTNVATKNAQYFKYYELGNELDLKLLVSGNGDVNTDYNMKKFKITAAYLKGMNDGIKSVQPGAQTMVDFSWLHYAYYQMLLDYGVKLDIVACHWYSEMEAIKLKAVPDITQKLTDLFHKPIWFTEVGERYLSNESNLEQFQSDFFTQFITKCKNNPNVKSLVFYELLNEPTKSPAQEANYGITRWMAPYTQWEYKMAGRTLAAK